MWCRMWGDGDEDTKRKRGTVVTDDEYRQSYDSSSKKGEVRDIPNLGGSGADRGSG